MSPATSSRTASDSLADTASSTLSLLRGFIALLSTPTTSTPPANIPADAPNPIDVLYSASTLLKAHVTKLALLMITTPFTPSEIRKIISDLANTCLPAMMSAVEICQPARFGRLLLNEVKVRVRKVFMEMEAMMLEVLAHVSSSPEGATRRDSLLSTGVVWEACDAVMKLKELGTVGLAVLKAQEYREMLEDALVELKEWAEDKDEQDEDDDNQDGFSDGGSELLNFDRPLPKDRPDVREAVEGSLKQLKLISTLYQALIKRRIKTIENDWKGGPSPFIATRLDHVMDILRRMPDLTDEMANAFYELDLDEARKIMARICDSGKDTIKLTCINWKSREDEFTTWAVKWEEAIDRASGGKSIENGIAKLTIGQEERTSNTSETTVNGHSEKASNDK